MANYRYISLCAAAIAVLLSAASISFLIVGITTFRRKDFFMGTTTLDFTTLGTCSEHATAKQLKDAELNKLKCNTNSKKRMRKVLEVHTHAIFNAYVNKGLDNMVMDRAARVVLGAVVGTASATMPSLNYSIAYDALVQASEQALPKTCENIYSMTEANIDSTLFALLQEEEDHATWPLNTISTRCDDADEAEETNADWAAAPDKTAIEAAKAKLYTHCVVQFRYASSGSEVGTAGTFNIPRVGVRPGPDPKFFYPNAHGYGELDLGVGNYSTRARIFQGQKFGYSVWAYVPMMLASAYLLADSLVFFVAEASLPSLLLEIEAISADALAAIQDSLVIAATSAAARIFRQALAFFAVLSSLVFWGVFLVSPYGLYESRVPRPYCETGNPKHEWELFYTGTKGGWKTDADTLSLELYTVIIQVFVLLLLPISNSNAVRSLFFRSVKNNRNTATDTINLNKFVEVTSAYKFSMRVLFPFLVIGGVGWIAGQSVSGARFGMGWAEGVMGNVLTTADDGTTTETFNEVILSEQVYYQTVATLMVTLVVGLMVGAATQRHLLNGVGCFSATLFFGWVALVGLFALPLIIYAGERSIFSKSEALRECDSFPSSYKFARGACEARFWSFLIAGGLVLGVLAIMTLIGVLQKFPQLCTPRDKAVPKSDNIELLGEAAPEDARDFEESFASLGGNKHAMYMELGGYRSNDESFYNYRTNVGKATRATASLLHAPPSRLKWELKAPARASRR